MNILVLLRSVRDPAGFTVNRKAQKIFVNREQFIINPADKNALEAALRLAAGDPHPNPPPSAKSADRGGDSLHPSGSSPTGEGLGMGVAVIAVAFGSAQAEDVLRQSRAMGAGRALLVREAALQNADAAVITSALQRIVTHLGGVDLVLLGDEVLDADLAQVGPRLAAALDWPFIESAHQLDPHPSPPPSAKEADRGGDSPAALTAITPYPDGFHKVEAPLPAVVSVAANSNQPRYAPGANIVNVYKAKDAVEALSPADLQLAGADLQLAGADLTPLVEPRGESFPPERELGKRLEGAPDEMAGQLADVIRKT